MRWTSWWVVPIFGCAGWVGCPSPVSPDASSTDLDAVITGVDTAAPVDASVPSRARVAAAEGGVLRSADGAFYLYIPAGALAEDTELSIEVVPPAEWAPETAASAPVGGVYDVQPDGLTFLEPVFALQTLPSRPATLVAADGASVLAVHRSRASDGTVEGVPTMTIELSGGFGILGRLTHLSTHWATAETVDGEQISVRVSASAGTRGVRVPWLVEEVRVQGSAGVTLPLDVQARAGVATEGMSNVEPLMIDEAFNGPFDAGLGTVLAAFGTGLWAYAPVHGATSTGTASALPFVVSPAPGWVCVAPGVSTAPIVVSGNATGAGVDLWFFFEIGVPNCVEREEKAEHIAAVAELGEDRISSDTLTVPGTTRRDLALTRGSYGIPIDIPAGATIRVCVAAGMPTSILYIPRFSPGFDFVDGAPGCTDITNRDTMNTNTVLLKLDGAGSPNEVTVTTSIP